MEWPAETGEVVITSLASGRAPAVGTVRLLGHAKPLDCSQTPAGLRVGLPRDESREGAYVMKIEWER